MKSVLISIKPKYCELIANGKKTIEVRKTSPKIETPFKCYIYQTKAKQVEHCDGCDITYYGCGKVIGEFICDRIEIFEKSELGIKSKDFFALAESCVKVKEMLEYIGENKIAYGLHISDLKIYDKPKELGEFCIPCKTNCEDCKKPLFYDCWDKVERSMINPQYANRFIREFII